MIKIEENVSLRPYNTFGIDVKAAYLCKIHRIEELQELIQSSLYQSTKHYILGGGSNILFTQNYDGLIIKVELKGIEILSETDAEVIINAKSGESWHGLVMHAVQNGWGGIENLSLIPGTVGAAPMQNIGAYGVEIKNVVENVEAIDLVTGSLRVFTNAECRFGYRESVFKRDLKEKYFISSVTLRLTKKNLELNTSYGAIHDTLREQQVHEVTIQTISNAVIQIRQSKLPDPKVVGNAGSFFKNPTITIEHYESLKKTHPSIPGYQTDNQYVKVPAGWLIEQCGWKGKKINQVGVHSKQALVLVNYGEGKGIEILKLADEIRHSVDQKFKIKLTPEVNIL